jgi:hypothetical protein
MGCALHSFKQSYPFFGNYWFLIGKFAFFQRIQLTQVLFTDEVTQSKARFDGCNFLALNEEHAVFNWVLTSVMRDEHKINDTGYALEISRSLSLELQFAVLCIFSAAPGQYASAF